MNNPYTKVTGCLCVCVFVCLFVPKDLANNWTDRVLRIRVASHRSQEGLKLFSWRVGHPQPPLKMKNSPPQIFLKIF